MWKLAKKTIREDEFEEGILTIDDTVEEKKYTDENEVNCYHFDRNLGRSVNDVLVGLHSPIQFLTNCQKPSTNKKCLLHY